MTEKKAISQLKEKADIATKRKTDESRSIKNLHNVMRTKTKTKQQTTLRYYLEIAQEHRYAALGDEVKRIICLSEVQLRGEFKNETASHIWI